MSPDMDAEGSPTLMCCSAGTCASLDRDNVHGDEYMSFDLPAVQQKRQSQANSGNMNVRDKHLTFIRQRSDNDAQVPARNQ